MRRLLTTPLLHFLVVGAVLFALRAATARPERAAGPVSITAERTRALQQAFATRTRLQPTPLETAMLVAREVDDELLYREALARGLDRGDDAVAYRVAQKTRFVLGEDELDPAELARQGEALGLDVDDVVVRRLLIEKMRLLGAGSPPPSPVAARAWFAAHAERFRLPDRVTLEHVFLSPGRRGARLDADAVSLARRLRVAGDADAVELGDPFPLGRRFEAASKASLAKLFGPGFAAAAFAVPPGAWSAPIRSAHGLHVVRVAARIPGALPDFADVRTQVEQTLRSAERERRLAALLDDLRERAR